MVTVREQNTWLGLGNKYTWLGLGTKSIWLHLGNNTIHVHTHKLMEDPQDAGLDSAFCPRTLGHVQWTAEAGGSSHCFLVNG